MANYMNRIVSHIQRHEILYLFIFVYLIYNMNLRTIGSGDTIPSTLLPFSILYNHNLYLDQFSSYFLQDVNPMYFMTELDDHYLSSYPIVTPVLATPIYSIIYTLLQLIQYPINIGNPGFALIVTIMEKLCASLIASLSVVFIFLSLKELLNKKIAFICTVIFAFATNTWTVSSQGLWQHGMAELLLSMMIYFVIINENRITNRNVAYLGVLSGLFMFNRPVDSVLLIPFFIYILLLGRKSFVYYLLIMFLSAMPFLFYNLYYFNSFFGGYNSLISAFVFDIEFITRFAGLLINPNRGLFVYTPILILSIFGYFKIKKMENPNLRLFLLTCAISVLSLVIVYSFFRVWWAGWSYGPRFFTDILPIMIIFLGFYLKDRFNFSSLNKKNIFTLSVILLLISWSISVQIIGVFCYPNGNWNGEPKNVDFHPERLWYLNDTQIMRNFNAGMAPTRNPINDIKTIRTYLKLDDNILINSQESSPVSLGGGWHGLEDWSDTPTRWMSNDATLTIYSDDSCTAELSFQVLSFYRPRTLEIYINDYPNIWAGVPNEGFVIVNAPINLNEGTNTVRFHVPEGYERPSDIPELKNPDDRCLSLAFQNIDITRDILATPNDMS